MSLDTSLLPSDHSAAHVQFAPAQSVDLPQPNLLAPPMSATERLRHLLPEQVKEECRKLVAQSAALQCTAEKLNGLLKDGKHPTSFSSSKPIPVSKRKDVDAREIEQLEHKLSVIHKKFIHESLECISREHFQWAHVRSPNVLTERLRDEIDETLTKCPPGWYENSDLHGILGLELNTFAKELTTIWIQKHDENTARNRQEPQDESTASLQKKVNDLQATVAKLLKAQQRGINPSGQQYAQRGAQQRSNTLAAPPRTQARPQRSRPAGPGPQPGHRNAANTGQQQAQNGRGQRQWAPAAQAQQPQAGHATQASVLRAQPTEPQRKRSKTGPRNESSAELNPC
jgi:hypothetical protein